MIKKLLPFVLTLSAATSFACPRALPIDDPNFCESFRTAASCHCTSSGLPSGVCQDMRQLYNRLLIVFGSLNRACAFQHHTSTEDCLNGWNCYMNGGVDSTGKLCNGTQQPCI